MKRFSVLCALFAIVFAQEAEESSDDGNTWEDIKNWASAKQDPVEFMTIIAPTPCMLKGAYGWFRKVGTDNVFIRETVHGCEIEDKSYVLTWAVLDDPDEPGMQEAFYCHVEYNKEQETAT